MAASDLWNPTSNKFIANPIPYYEEIRKYGPLFKSKSGDYVVIGYDACKEALQHPNCIVGLQRERAQKLSEYGKDRGENFTALEDATSGMLVQLNEPIHPLLRSALAKSWPSSKMLKSIANSATETLIDQLKNSFDAIGAICKKLPIIMICDILGLKKEEALLRTEDSLRLVQVLYPYLSHKELKEVQQSAVKMKNFIFESITAAEYRATPLTKAVMKSTREISGISEVSVLMFLFIAGFETTSTLLATCIRELILNKRYLEKINRYGIQPFVKEMLRIYSPVQITGRKTTSELVLGGIEIPRDAVLTLCIGAANLDPEHFVDPERVIWDREKHSHLSFGYGIHHCLGSQLAELEAEALIKKILPLIPKMELNSAATYENKLTIRSFKSLPITVK